MRSRFPRGAAVAGLLSACLLLANAAWAKQVTEAQHWLERMTEAVRSLNYKGTFVYKQGDSLETMRIVHRADSQGEQERLYSLTGTPREVIRDNDKVVCIFADDQMVTLDRNRTSNPFSDVLPHDLTQVAEHYTFELEGQDRIAEREAQVVAIMPRDGYRYGYRLWLDRDNGLLLRSDLFNELGHVVEQLVFTRVELFDTIPDEWLKPALSGNRLVWRRDAGSSAEPPGEAVTWQVDAPPPGFQLTAHERRPFGGREVMVDHFLYSDGLATVSVYVEPADPEHAFNGRSRSGALNAYGQWRDGYQVTVVGEVPGATVKRMGDALSREEAQ